MFQINILTYKTKSTSLFFQPSNLSHLPQSLLSSSTKKGRKVAWRCHVFASTPSRYNAHNDAHVHVVRAQHASLFPPCMMCGLARELVRAEPGGWRVCDAVTTRLITLLTLVLLTLSHNNLHSHLHGRLILLVLLTPLPSPHSRLHGRLILLASLTALASSHVRLAPPTLAWQFSSGNHVAPSHSPRRAPLCGRRRTGARAKTNHHAGFSTVR